MTFSGVDLHALVIFFLHLVFSLVAVELARFHDASRRGGNALYVDKVCSPDDMGWLHFLTRKRMDEDLAHFESTGQHKDMYVVFCARLRHFCPKRTISHKGMFSLDGHTCEGKKRDVSDSKEKGKSNRATGKICPGVHRTSRTGVTVRRFLTPLVCGM